MNVKQILLGGAGGGSVVADAGLAVLRAFAGLSLALAHGLGKFQDPSGIIAGARGLGFPAPTFFGYMAMIAEFFGGLLLALGLATRPAAFLILCTMTTAGFLFHARDPFARKELAFLYLAISIAFLLIGSGRFGIDALLVRRKQGGRGFDVVRD